MDDGEVMAKHTSIIYTRGQANDHAFPNHAFQEIRWRARGGNRGWGSGRIVGWRRRGGVVHRAGGKGAVDEIRKPFEI